MQNHLAYCKNNLRLLYKMFGISTLFSGTKIATIYLEYDIGGSNDENCTENKTNH